MSKRNVYEWTDVLDFGSREANGFEHSWNSLHNILVKDEFCPMYEAYTRDYDISEFDYGDRDPKKIGYGMSKETCDVVLAFMKSEDITDMLITR